MTFADLPQGTSVFVDGNTLVYHFQPYAVFGAACGVPLVGCPFGLWHLRNSGFVPVLYPEGVALHSPGSRSAPWESVPPRSSTPKGLYNPFGVEVCGVGPGPRVRCATLGCGVQPLRGRGRWVDLVPGCAVRPWAVLSNPFGVRDRVPSARPELRRCQNPKGHSASV